MKIKSLLLIAVLGLAAVAGAQGVTTGSLSGVVTDPNGEPLPGVTVAATLSATGTRYTAVTDAMGVFRIINTRVGGPYEVTADLPGFKPQTANDVRVLLGETTFLEMTLQLEAATGEIVVVGQASDLINPTRMGVASSVSERTLDSMPTVERNLYDFARTNPVFSTFSPEEDATVLSVAGRNPRYNNISIDGAVNNDVFGLAASGTPGGQSRVQPIQLDAVQELQLVTSSFDVRQGGFTGGSVNVITKSGSNEFHGGVFGYTSSDSWVGDGPDFFNEFGTYDDLEYGFLLGGPIVKDKAFFFVNYGRNELDEPTGWSLDGSSGQPWQNGNFVAEAEEFRQFNIDTYGYDPGGLGELTIETPSDKFFVRFDLNLDVNNTLTARYNYVDASNVLNRPDDGSYEWPNEAYDFTNETNSLVAQWNAVFGVDKFNELRVTYQTIRDRRTGVGDRFPHIQINNVDGDFNSWQAGTEQFSTFNLLDTDIIEITNDFTFFAGDHEITIGTHNEFYSFRNLFIQDGFGSYQFDTLEDYYAGIASRYDHTFPNDPANPADEFDTYQLGLYAGDTWRVRPNLTLVYGLRVDAPFFPDSPDYNPLADDTFGVRTDDIPDGNLMWSPRAGFNWDITGDGIKQLRGGIGLFSGRTPYVWISNNYGRTGTRQTTIRAFGNIPFNPDPDNQPTDIGGASTQEINAVDPDFEFPQTWRANLAYDQRLPWWNMVATAEVLYGWSENEIDYKNLNIVQTGETLPFDGRPIYEQLSSSFSGAYFLTNTSKGDATNVIVKLEKPYGDLPLWGSVSYTWGESNVVNDGTSSRAVSNWQYTEAVDPNNVGLSASDFQVEHRAMINLNYEFNRDSRWSTTLSLFWNRQSGRPYSNIYAFNFPSINQDRYMSNDLFYVPSGADDVEITNGTWEQLDSYISRAGLSQYKGQIAPRNVVNQPWVTQTDLAIRQNIPIPGNSSLQISLDIFNFWNLVDEDSGLVRYVAFGTVTPVTYRGVNDEGKPIYELRGIVTDPEENDIFTYNDLRSRWRARLGVRWTF
ncbi:MAG TPA: TonB-dependent receptor [Methylomirabilota bacterium]|nr:TonB-dependent receptor [Methylomirabilota bacterium]